MSSCTCRDGIPISRPSEMDMKKVNTHADGWVPNAGANNNGKIAKNPADSLVGAVKTQAGETAEL